MLASLGFATDGAAIFLLVFVAVAVMLVLLRRATARSAGQNIPARNQIHDIKQRAAAHHVMDDVLVQLEQCAREMNAQLDTKFLRLETVIRDADDRIARLERVLEQVEDLRGLLAAGATARAAQRPHEPDAPADRCERAAPQPPPENTETAEDFPPPDAPHGRVYALADAGKPAMEIAEESGLTLGEVELLLRLRRMA